MVFLSGLAVGVFIGITILVVVLSLIKDEMTRDERRKAE